MAENHREKIKKYLDMHNEDYWVAMARYIGHLSESRKKQLQDIQKSFDELLVAEVNILQAKYVGNKALYEDRIDFDHVAHREVIKQYQYEYEQSKKEIESLLKSLLRYELLSIPKEFYKQTA